MKKMIIILLVTSLACAIPMGVTSPKAVTSAISAPTPPVIHYDVTGTVNVRSCASTTCGVVDYLYRGDSVPARCHGNWCEVENGWVYAPCLGMKGTCK